MTGTYIAPAKINLGLEVLYKRSDGYHQLNTVFLRVPEPHDTITVTPAGSFRLTCSDPSLPTDNRNIVMWAAEEFCKMYGMALPKLHVHLEKNIPIGAGLGGGSSDAATMLNILKEWQNSSGATPAHRNEILLAAQLGADVPFFASGAALAKAGGIGEELHPIEANLSAAILIVVHPEIRVSTREAFQSLNIPAQRPLLDYQEFIRNTPAIEQWKEMLVNDFEPEIFRTFPELGEIKHRLYARGASFALMSGSGSAIYGLFRNNEDATQATLSFQREGNLAFLSTR